MLGSACPFEGKNPRHKTTLARELQFPLQDHVSKPKIQGEEGNAGSKYTYALILSNSISARLTSTSRCSSASLASARRVAWILSRLIPILSLVWVVVNSASAVAFSDFRLVSKTAVSALIRLISCLVLPRFSASYNDLEVSIISS